MKNNKIFKICGIAFKVIIGIIIIAFVMSVILQRFTNNEFSFFNFRMFSVLTGSMEPKYEIGNILISKETNPENIEIGDSISYLGAEGSFKDKVITHEVIGIEKDENDEFMFRTKGIANSVEDPIVHESQVYGVVIYKSIILSAIYGIVSQPWGMYLFIFLPILAYVGYEIIIKMLEKEEERRRR